MNLSDLYAIYCLLVWGGATGFAVAMLCRGKLKSRNAADKFPISTFSAALIVGMLLQMILLSGNLNYLAHFLWFFALRLAGIVTVPPGQDELVYAISVSGQGAKDFANIDQISLFRLP